MKTALINMLGCSAESVVARFSENNAQNFKKQ